MSQPKDQEIVDIVNYVLSYKIESSVVWETAGFCLLDAIGCAFLSLQFAQCKKMLGPIVPNTIVPNGVRIPGTKYILDPVTGAFSIGSMIRWLDFNDTWLAKEWGHPSDNLGAILSTADYVSQTGDKKLVMKDVLEAQIKAYEIQGCLALENSFNRFGLDHVILVKIASTAVSTFLMGGNEEQIFNAISNALLDGGVLRTYRHFPNAGSRKSWAAGDACSRAVWHALQAIQGEQGYATALSAPKWGFYDSMNRGEVFHFQRPYGEYVMENILFKVSFPAEFHAQTAVECALLLHPLVKHKFDFIEAIHIDTHKAALVIIDKKGELTNYADRDHCIQYMIAVPLIFGNLTAEQYEDVFHLEHKQKIDELRSKMILKEEEQFSKDYLDPEKRSIANRITIEWKDGSFTEPVTIQYPIGHKRRRQEAYPLLIDKTKHNLMTFFKNESKVNAIIELILNQDKLWNTPVTEFMQMLHAES